MRICECREPAEMTPCNGDGFRRRRRSSAWGQRESTWTAGPEGAARVASDGSMTWREGVGSDGVDPSCEPPEMLTHPPHLVGGS